MDAHGIDPLQHYKKDMDEIDELKELIAETDLEPQSLWDVEKWPIIIISILLAVLLIYLAFTSYCFQSESCLHWLIKR